MFCEHIFLQSSKRFINREICIVHPMETVLRVPGESLRVN